MTSVSKIKTLVTKINLYRGDDNPLFGDSVTSLELDDEAGGMFLKIIQEPNDFGPGGTLRFDFDEIDDLFKTINHLKQLVEIAEKDSNG
jgi:hypothetical protein